MTRDPCEALRSWRASTGYTAREVGALFGVTKEAVQHWEHGRCSVPRRVQARLRAEGWLASRGTWWAPEHDAWLAVHRGAYPLPELAARLTAAFGIPRTPMSIQQHLYARGESPQAHGLLTRAQVAVLCGVTPPTVKRWVDRGQFQIPDWARRGIRGWWAIPPAALTAFIDAHAVQLDVAAMPPSLYRDQAAAYWTRERWMDTETASQYAQVHRTTICQWIANGWVPAVRRYRANAIYIWMIRARDLAAFLRQRRAA